MQANWPDNSSYYLEAERKQELCLSRIKLVPMVVKIAVEVTVEKEMAPYSNILAWKIPSQRSLAVQSMGLQRVGHN